MRIGELAKKTGVNPKTLRYWEEIGLLPSPKRNSLGYRIYSNEHIQICEFIIKAKSLGFKLNEIKDILYLKFSGIEPCGCVQDKIKEKIKNIESMIEELEKKKELLEELLSRRRESPAFVCPIIESIE